MKDVQVAVSKIGSIDAGQQALALDTKKGFASAETQADGLLRQAQDTLKCLQSETKELKDKLIKIDTVGDSIASSCKQLSLDIHVSRTKREQQMDSFLADFKQFVGHTRSSLNGLGPVIPTTKTALDHLNNAIDYLASAYKANERTEPILHNMQEQTNNIEDRLVRQEALVMGLTDTANDTSEMCQQLKEGLNLLHDNVTTVLERFAEAAKEESTEPRGPTYCDFSPSSSPTTDPQCLRRGTPGSL